MNITTPHKAVLWTAGVLDGFGDPSFNAPVEIDCRWQDRNQKYQSLAGDERISNSQIYYQEADLIKPGDRIARGSMNSLLLKIKTVDELVAIALDLDLTWIDAGQSLFSQEVYEGLLIGSLVLAMIEGAIQGPEFDGSLIRLLSSDEQIDDLDYSLQLEPFNSPYVRMVGSVESTSSIGGQVNLYKAMTEVYAKGY